ncbi:DUF4433 domain-containing protein [Candidatus Sumerlaeota bacterium]|nr:DUF4433 domain-containing protein [Candidatus Sumerlaeota bacterium]
MISHFKYLYHMTHYRNLTRIMQEGILSHTLAHKLQLTAADVSSRVVQAWRQKKREPVYNRVIHDYAPFYLNPRNPMLYVRQYVQHAVVILCVTSEVLKNHQYVLTDGNAASKETAFSIDESVLKDSREVLAADDWRAYPDGKRRRCAEVLVFPKVEPEYIHHVICQNQLVADIARVMTGRTASVDQTFYFPEA